MKAEIEVTYTVTIEIPDNDEILKEYENIDEAALDMASYRFYSTLPIMRRLTSFSCEVENVEVTKK